MDSGLPIFSVAGQPNEGKTTVLATLAEDDQAAISPRPGTTLRCHEYPVLIDGREVIRFVDTPGFEEAPEAVEWFQQHQEKEGNLAAAFIQEHRKLGLLGRECELLEPIAAGAAIIYVVDASRPVRQVDKDEMEILRLCGNPRLSVINSKGDDSRHFAEWKTLLTRKFPCVHRFNAHGATFRDRMNLLEAVKTVIQDWQPGIEQAVKAFRWDWDARLADASDKLCDYIKDVMTFSVRRQIHSALEAEAAKEQSNAEWRAAVVEKEQAFRRHIRRIFKHSEDHWKLEGYSLLTEDPFSEEVWKLMGLPKMQLILASAIMGMVIGGIIDIHAAFATLMLGSAVGFAAGGVLGWLSADQAADVTIPGFDLRIPKTPIHFQFKGTRLGGSHAEARANPQSNLGWILTDRALAYIELASSWSHGRREPPLEVKQEKPAKVGATSQWTKDQSKILIDFIAQYRAKNPPAAKRDGAHREARDLFHHLLREMTGW